MLDLNFQKTRFKNHFAELQDLGDVKILNFQEPNTSNYHIRFIFDEASYTLTITGDLGYLVAWNPTNMKFDTFHQFTKGVNYFREKIRCMNRNQWDYNENLARKQLEELFEGLEFDEIDYVCCVHDTPKDDLIEDILEDLGDNGLGSRGYDLLSEHIDDAWEEAAYLGRESSGMVELYLLAFDLAYTQLKERGVI